MAMFGPEDAGMARVCTREAAHKKPAASGGAKVSHSAIVPPPEKMNINSELRGEWWTRQGLNL
jgi:hypothetical protein